MHVLKHLSFIEDKYLRVLVRDKELYQVRKYYPYGSSINDVTTLGCQIFCDDCFLSLCTTKRGGRGSKNNRNCETSFSD